MRNEERLIHLFSRSDLEKSDKAQINDLLKERLDWNTLREQSGREGVSGLVYYHLVNRKLSDGAGSYFDQLKMNTQLHSVRNTIMTELTKKIIKIFNEKKIKIILLKGIFLANNVYKYPALRPMSDVDILIKKEDLSEANEVLNSFGYKTPPIYKEFLRHKSGSLNTLFYVKNSSTHLPIHLHWHLVNTTWPLDSLVDKIDMGRIWSRAEPVKIGDVDALSLAPEHLLIYLSYHAFKHYFDKLIRITDIMEVLKFYEGRMDWEVVHKEAERFTLSYILYHSLLFSSQTLNFDIPQLEKIRPKKLSFFEKILFSSIRKGLRHGELYKLSYTFNLSMEKGLFHKLRFIWRTFFPSRFTMAHGLNLPVTDVRFQHYLQRIVRRFS